MTPPLHRRPTALLVSELGIGMGHAKRLLVIGRALKARGWHVTATMRELWTCTDEFNDARIPLLQSPMHLPVLPPGAFAISSYADLAAACGFGAVNSLWASVLGWTATFDLVRPDLIVADYSPLATLAAFDRLPVLAIGDGFVLPPPHLTRMPSIGTAAAAPADEDRLMVHAAIVQGRLGRRTPSHLSVLVGGQAHVVCTYPELDIYAGDRPAPAAGSLLPGTPPLPPAVDPAVFLYLNAGARITQPLLRALAATALPAEAYLRDATEALKEKLRKENPRLRLHDMPPPLSEMLPRSTLVVHHGGIGTLELCLAAGRPQFLASSQFEQSLNVARCVAGQLAATITRHDTDASLQARLTELATGRHTPARLAAVAADIARRPPNAAIEAVLTACDRLL